MAKASIIIPVYNKEKYLKETLVSVDKQTEDDLEVVIVDDASTDSSMDIIRDFAGNTKKQVKVIQNDKNQGVAYSRNIGVEEASGEYVSFVDADDIMSFDFTEIMLSKFKNYSDIDSVNLCPISFDSEHGDLNSGRIDYYYINRVMVPSIEPTFIPNAAIGCTAKVFRKTSIQNLKFFESSFEDYEFFLCTIAEDLKILCTNDTKYRYRIVPEGKYQQSLSNRTSFLENFEIFDRIKAQYLNIHPGIFKGITEKQISICLKHLDFLLSELNMTVMHEIRFISNYLQYMKINYSYMESIPLSLLGYSQKMPDDPEELKANLKSIVMKY